MEICMLHPQELSKMDNRQLSLIAKALEKHPDAVMMNNENVSCLSDSFREFRGRLTFWYDTPDNNTHIAVEDLN